KSKTVLEPRLVWAVEVKCFEQHIAILRVFFKKLPELICLLIEAHNHHASQISLEQHPVFFEQIIDADLAQVSGFRGEVEDDNHIINRVKYDIFYLENWSLLLDVKIVFQTIFNALRGEDKAY
ncbi:sugar transferase, partial [Flavobacteriaceae bacterium]|nr:sugar transferase [Flavobacteriaceae bacterium]